MGRRRRRRDGTPPNQLNPLKQQYFDCDLVLPEDWLHSTYCDISKPFVIDLGCGEGEWCISAAKNYPNYNYLGLEIRIDALRVGCRNAVYPVPLINDDESTLNCPGNVGFIHSNLLRGDLHEIFDDLMSNHCSIHFIAVQFPDPHWKKKHHKRRILKRSLVLASAANLDRKGILYIQSDAKNVVDDVESMLVSDIHDDNVEGVESSVRRCFDFARHTTPPLVPLDEDLHSLVDTKIITEQDGNRILTEEENSCVLAVGRIGSDEESDQTMNWATANGNDPCSAGDDRSDWFWSLPPCFHEVPTERTTYVRRQNKSIHHLVCRLRDESFIKRSALCAILERREKVADLLQTRDPA